ncbi:MAG TPA: 2,3,4,5-tetrahydropyridine-2,6-dicarboxylate N-succinyltransferase, partial [Cellvibrio sp.]|nr:2,3,4,5-tetrahydropyridine-2,6-dicarboxylate N-succinyltransferase [Cellvibrio sp.]
MTTLYALGLGVGTQNSKGEWLEVFYPRPLLNPNATTAELVAEAVGYQGGNTVVTLTPEMLNRLNGKAGELDEVIQAFQESRKPLVAVLLANNDGPKSVPEAYLKLHLLSHRLVKPHGTKLDGIFGVLPNVAWTNKGAMDLADLPKAQLAARLKGELLSVDSVDKFPKMTDYVLPKGVRIADTARVRLGAYLGEGTTIMHEGFVNFNAGTLGTSMVEGRISAGVVIG